VPITVRVLDIGELKKFVTEDDMRAAANYALSLQKERIAKGIGSRGRSMKRLSKAYAEEIGRSVRTLNKSGRMMNSRRVVEVKQNRATIGFVAAPKYAYVNQSKTPFVKATKEERNIISKFLTKRIKERLRRQHAFARSRKS